MREKTWIESSVIKLLSLVNHRVRRITCRVNADFVAALSCHSATYSSACNELLFAAIYQ